MQFVFALTLLVSATLLFLVQPMFAKMVLPRLGGTPGVWNTCMVFYQAALLGGYLYAHFSTKWLGKRRQAVLHLALLAMPFLFLPLAVRGPQTWSSGLTVLGSTAWLVWMLTLSVGVPFFVVSATAPMLQSWFADTGHRSAKDPYFLYAASNLGSMLSLVGYPVLVEPYLPLAAQSAVWRLGFVALAVLIAACAVLLWKSAGPKAAEPEAGEAPQAVDDGSTAAPTAAQRLRWLALSFAPSSLLLGVTTFMSTDLASLPLLWIIPLALYLLTFVIVFAKRPLVSHLVMVWVQPFMVTFLAVLFSVSVSHRHAWMVLLLHLMMFFVTTMVCHGELARSRPSASHLTEFYLWMSLGGVLGGLFNALIAPLVFKSVIEYPLVIAVACMLRPPVGTTAHPVRARWMDLLLPLWLWFALRAMAGTGSAPHATQWLGVTVPAGAMSAIAVLLLSATGWMAFAFRNWAARVAIVSGAVLLAATFSYQQGAEGASVLAPVWKLLQFGYDKREAAVLGLGALVAFSFVWRPVRFGLGIGAVLLAGQLWFTGNNDVILQERSFFGVLRVKFDRAEKTHTLVHGSTTHGVQSTEKEHCDEPMSYYDHEGPLGCVFDELIDPKQHKHIAVIGLGTGTTAAYAQQGQEFTYFEIDPAIVRIAGADETEDDDDRFYYFTYIRNARLSRGAKIDVVLGDARLSLVDQPDGYFDLMVVDAFSSDAIPIHLLTREALALYFRKLAPDGILLVHVSNRYLDLAPVVGNLARDAGLVARVMNDSGDDLRFGSEWVTVVRKAGRLDGLLTRYECKEIPPDDVVGIWTDDFSNILGVLTWWRESKLCKWLTDRRTGKQPSSTVDKAQEPPAVDTPQEQPSGDKPQE